LPGQDVVGLIKLTAHPVVGVALELTADLVLSLLDRDPLATINDVVNVGGTIEIPILEVAKTIIKITDSQSEIRFLDPLEEGDMTRRKPDTAKMSQLINKPLVTFEEGLQRVIYDTAFILQ